MPLVLSPASVGVSRSFRDAVGAGRVQIEGHLDERRPHGVDSDGADLAALASCLTRTFS